MSIRFPSLSSEPLVTIAYFVPAIEAAFARGALESVGIRAAVPEERFGPFSTVSGSQRAALQVFQSDRERALLTLARMQMRVVEPVEDPDDA